MQTDDSGGVGQVELLSNVDEAAKSTRQAMLPGFNVNFSVRASHQSCLHRQWS
jgi:hypothetical protein